MVEIEIAYEGRLSCRATHGPSGAEVVTDAPVDNQGLGRGFSPTDLVATALGTCMLTIMGIFANAREIDLEGATVRVVKHMTPPPRRIGRLEVEIRVPAELDDRARAGLREAALGCPVHRSLHPEVEIPVTFHFGADAKA